MKFKVGDVVKKMHDQQDIIYKIIKIEGKHYILKGIDYRLVTDANLDELKICSEEKEDFFYKPEEGAGFERDNFFYLPGRILHIDGDVDYLAKCMALYKKADLDVTGLYVAEDKIPLKIKALIQQHRPDIVVITGHDALYNNQEYKNSSNFITSVIRARELEKSQDKLIIIAGACQSNYLSLIKAGANFASSPKGLNIHALDPAIIAILISFSNRNKDIDLLNILNKTKYKTEGMGGIITKGTMYVGFPK